MVHAGMAKNLAIIVVEGFGKRQQGVPQGQGACLSESDVGPTTGHDVHHAIPQPLSQQDMACPDMPMERSQPSNKLRGLYLPGLIDGTCVKWLIDTGAC